MTEPNYLSKILQLISEGKLLSDDGLQHVVVAHDSWCGIHQGKRCNCDPEITVRRPECN